jgi:outer membrane protein TolC
MVRNTAPTKQAGPRTQQVDIRQLRKWLADHPERKATAEGRSGTLPNSLRTALLIILLVMIPTAGAFTQMMSASTPAQSLSDYQRTAAENNPGLQSLYKEFEAAMQKIPQVESLSDPSLSFGYFISPVETRVGPQRARFSLTQMFPWFGTLKAQSDAAALMAEARYQSFLDARNRLYYKVSAAYYPLWELSRWKTIEQENIAILGSYKNLANSRFENGSGTMVDLLRVEIMLEEAETSLRILEQKEKPLLATFNALLNREADAAVTIGDPPVMELEEEAIAGVDHRRDSMFLENPRLQALDLKRQAGEAGEVAARKQGLPKIGVGLDYVVVGERNDVVIPENGRDVLMPMVSVTIPVFRKKYNASVREAQLMQESYALQKKESANMLSADYESARFEMERQRELLNSYDRQIRETEQALNLLLSAYSNAGREFEELLRMQQQLLKYEKMKAAAVVQYKIAAARLDYITAKNLHGDPPIIGN